MDPENQEGNHSTEPASQSLFNHEGCDTDDVGGSSSISGPVTVPTCSSLTFDNTDALQEQIHEEPVISSDKDSDDGVQSETLLNCKVELVSREIHMLLEQRNKLEKQKKRIEKQLQQCEAAKLELQAMQRRCQFLDRHEDKLRCNRKCVSLSRASSTDKSQLHGGITSPAMPHSEKFPRRQRAAPDLLDPTNTDSANSKDLQPEDAPPGLVDDNGISDPSCSSTVAASSELLPAGGVSSGSIAAAWERLGARPKLAQMQHQPPLAAGGVSSGPSADWEHLGGQPKLGQKHQPPLPAGVSSGSSADWEHLGARPKQGPMQHQPPLPAGGVSSGSNADCEHLGARPKQGPMQRQPPLPAGGVSSGSSADWEHLGARPKQGPMQRQPPLPAGVSSGSSADWEHLGARPKQGPMQCQPALPAECVSSGSSAEWEHLGARPKLGQKHQTPLPAGGVSSGSSADWEHLGARPKLGQKHQPPLPAGGVSSGSSADCKHLGAGPKQGQMPRQPSLPAGGVSSGSRADWERLGAQPKQGQMQLQPPLPAVGVSGGSSADWERLGAQPKLVQIQCQTPDGIADTFLAKHLEDDTILGRLYRGNLSNRSTTDWESLDTQPSPLQGQHLLAETRPETMSPLSDGIAWDFLLRHSQDPTVLERVVAKQEAITTTHFLCSHCFHEQELQVDGNSCRRNMPAYVCFNCGDVSCTDDVPYQCQMCGINRIQTEKACQEQCCFCLEDAFSGRQWLPCSHTLHRECLLAMIQDGIIACPICRYPLYNPSGW